jgi:hypothetical protein
MRFVGWKCYVVVLVCWLFALLSDNPEVFLTTGLVFSWLPLMEIK